ncbi:DUF6282 family protein [Microtetraspora sp. NBRC 16547]|uniref:DUF6282 family protein n=1 Tax=Microtetraspora sp. NBRC 16547 TaxID=3030993 RepID=UPI0024A45FE5|nr:DUF6282 family protein [Microtetraspora sp. NBRC 16547]GLW98288.1 hypothetical protein Misp02_23750 [Microtetraspora sp. NBRC 16547]
MSDIDSIDVSVQPPLPDRLLEGAVDTHVHAAPFIDDSMFLVDVFQLSRAAADAGMRAVVLKNWFGSSCPAAFLANRYAGGVQVLGGVVLNFAVGGINADAVRVAAHEGYDRGFRPGRVVWMPERSSLFRARLLGLDAEDQAKALSPFPGGDIDRPITPQAREVLDVIAEEDMVLATSHLGPDEALVFLEHARAAGVTRMVVTHASSGGVRWSLDQKKRAVELGACIEEAAISWQPAMKAFGYPVTDAAVEMFAAMREIGPEHYVLASDSGMKIAPSPIESMRVFATLLLASGFTGDEVRAMAVENPRRLLRLDQDDHRPPTTRNELKN